MFRICRSPGLIDGTCTLRVRRAAPDSKSRKHSPCRSYFYESQYSLIVSSCSFGQGQIVQIFCSSHVNVCCKKVLSESMNWSNLSRRTILLWGHEKSVVNLACLPVPAPTEHPAPARKFLPDSKMHRAIVSQKRNANEMGKKLGSLRFRKKQRTYNEGVFIQKKCP